VVHCITISAGTSYRVNSSRQRHIDRGGPSSNTEQSSELEGARGEDARGRQRIQALSGASHAISAQPTVDPRASEEVKRQVEAQRTKLDPVRLLSDIRAVQQRLVEIADTPKMMAAIDQPPLEQFRTGLRTTWQEGEVRPTARPNDVRRQARALRCPQTCQTLWRRCGLNPRHPETGERTLHAVGDA
jgi:hypothetical protein